MFAHEMRWAGASRVNTLDVGRGLAIVCVLYAHALAPWFMGGDPFNEQAFLQWKFGASFMMAFFFFISGMGWRDQRSLETTFRQAIALVFIAWAASVMFDVLRYAIGLAGASAYFGYEPFGLDRLVRNAARMAVFGDAFSMSALWFLVALAMTRVIAALSFRLGAASAWGVALLLLGVSLFSTEFSWRNFYQLNLIGIALVCFLAGHALRSLPRTLEAAPRATLAICALAAAATIGTFDLNQGCRWDMAAQCGQDWLGGRFGVSMIIGQFGNLFWFAVTTAAGLVLGLTFSVLVARFGARVGEQAAIWGRASIDLVIVNCLVLQLTAPAIGFFIAPHVPADNALFFIALLVVTLIANVGLMMLLSRPLRRLRAFASWSAGLMVETARRGAALARAPVRVSQEP